MLECVYLLPYRLQDKVCIKYKSIDKKQKKYIYIFNTSAEFPYIFQFTFPFHLGAAIANHVKVTDLVKNDEGRIVGAKMRDQLTGDTWITKAKSVVNATGPFTGV